MAVATLSLAGCVAVHETLTDRALTCDATPDDLCLAIADLAVREGTVRLDAGRAAPVDFIAVHVGAIDCSNLALQRKATRCWDVEASYPDGFADIPISEPIPLASVSVGVFLRPDGTLAVSP